METKNIKCFSKEHENIDSNCFNVKYICVINVK